MRVTNVESNLDVDDPVASIDPAASAAFTNWYRAEFHQVVALVYVLCGSRWAAEELTQDAFVQAHKNWAEIADYQNPGAWVRRVAVNRARSWGRRRAAEKRVLAKHFARR
ncbi:MAG: sigma factor, partial [Acidimicrobiales bacterium]